MTNLFNFLLLGLGAPTVSSNIGLISNISNSSAFANQENNPPVEIKIEDGKLLYERRWFHRGQPVFVEGKDIPRFPGIISGISNEIVRFFLLFFFVLIFINFFIFLVRSALKK